MTSKKKFMIFNNSVKPPKLNAQGQDTRSTLEKVGFLVSFTDSEGRPLLLHPTKPPVFVSELHEGIINHARAGNIRIEEVDDVVTALKQHTIQRPAPFVSQSATGTAEVNADIRAAKDLRSSTVTVKSAETIKAETAKTAEAAKVETAKVETAAATTSHPSAGKAKATEMGDHTAAEKVRANPTYEHEGAVNPDGEPNFVVKAKGSANKKKDGSLNL